MSDVLPAGLLANHLPEPVDIPAAGILLHGTLTLPPYPLGVVLFAHGSGSSRFSARNRRVANALVSANLGTLLFDLLSDQEEAERANVFDVELLAGRLQQATDWIAARPATAGLPVGYFGASTGAAAALAAAAGDAHAPLALCAMAFSFGFETWMQCHEGSLRSPSTPLHARPPASSIDRSRPTGGRP